MRFFPLLLGLLFCTGLAAKWGDNNRVKNLCDRNITGYRNYIDGLFSVSIEKVAGILLDDHAYIIRYKDVFEDKAYIQLSKDIHDEVVTPWTENQDGWIQRRVQYGRHVHDAGFVKHATVSENHTALYQDEQLILNKRVRNLETFISGILIEVEYCSVRAGKQDTYVEVDVKLSIENALLMFVEDTIMESSERGFITTYHGLAWLLRNYIPTHPEDTVNLSVRPTTKKITRLPALDPKKKLELTEKKVYFPVSTINPIPTRRPLTWLQIGCFLLGIVVIAGFIFAAFCAVKKYFCSSQKQPEPIGDERSQFLVKYDQNRTSIEHHGSKRSIRGSEV